MKKKRTVSDYASEGGKARAKALTAQERKEIATAAADARWLKEGVSRIPRAEYGSPESPLRIGEREIPCYVLADGRRVLHQTGMVRAMGMSHGGSYSRGGDRLAKFVGQERLKPFVSDNLISRTVSPIKFRSPLGGVAYGYEATVLAAICDAVLAARKDGRLMKQQEHIAAQCEILVRGFARVGIIALVDEVTGYQAARAKDTLSRILEEFIAEEIRKWIKTFPDEFYREMFRLRGWEYPPESVRKPRLVGNLTNNVVYRRLAPGVLDELKRKIPRDDKGRHKTQLHRGLTDELGHPRLREHLSAVIALMKASSEWDGFIHMLDMALPKYNTTKLLRLK